MTNLESKQDAIKKAYGEHWDKVKDYVDENGWASYPNVQQHDYDFGKLEFKDGCTFLRPESLQGIENNNGWIKIESDDDIPKNDMYVHIVFNKKMNIAFLCDGEFFAPNKEKYNKKGVTHYQPIETKKQPIW